MESQDQTYLFFDPYKTESKKEVGDFGKFCKENEQFLPVISKIVATTPKLMNKLEGKFDISSYQCNQLERYFGPNLIDCSEIWFDMIYKDGSNTARISVKSATEFFQRQNKSNKGMLTFPKQIVLKNYRSVPNKLRKPKGFDYLLAIEGKRCEIGKNGYTVCARFGIISLQDIQKYVVIHKANPDQLRVKIFNKDWGFLSPVLCTKFPNNIEKQNEKYKNCKKSMWDVIGGD